MKTLKQTRIQAGKTQIETAKAINVQTANYCNVENGNFYPQIEEAVMLERYFEQQIDWSEHESLSETDKERLVEIIVNLCERYPIYSLMNFVAKSIKRDSKTGDPLATINFYERQSHLINQHGGSLPPPDVTE